MCVVKEIIFVIPFITHTHLRNIHFLDAFDFQLDFQLDIQLLFNYYSTIALTTGIGTPRFARWAPAMNCFLLSRRVSLIIFHRRLQQLQVDRNERMSCVQMPPPRTLHVRSMSAKSGSITSVWGGGSLR